MWPFKKQRKVIINVALIPDYPIWIEGVVQVDGQGREYVKDGRRIYFLKNYPSTHIVYVNYTPGR